MDEFSDEYVVCVRYPAMSLMACESLAIDRLIPESLPPDLVAPTARNVFHRLNHLIKDQRETLRLARERLAQEG